MAVFSDVHESLDHLEAVLEDIRATGLTDVWCLGDFVDGGDNAARVFERVTAACTITLLGNHELNLLGQRGDGVPADSDAGRLGDELTERLRELRPFHHEPAVGVYMTHASLFGVWEGFAQSDEDDVEEHLVRTLREAFEPITLVGHTHQPLYAQLIEGYYVFDERPEIGKLYRLSMPCLLNPGAVRDRLGAHWLELHLTAAPTATWHLAAVS